MKKPVELEITFPTLAEIEALIASRPKEALALSEKLLAQHGKSDMACQVESFLKAIAKGRYKIPKTIGDLIMNGEPLKVSTQSRLSDKLPPPELVGTVLNAVASGDVKTLRNLAAAVQNVHDRAEKKNGALTIHPAKPVLAAALESIGAPVPKSGEDINQDVWANTGNTITERHARRLAAKLGKPPKNKGGCGTHKH